MGSGMLKKILPLVFLAALIAYGVYHYTQNHGESQSSDKDQAAENSDNGSDAAKKAETGIENGDKAPDFTLKKMNGKSASLSDYRGKKVIVNFWATWCPPCRAEMPEMQDYYKQHKDDDFVVLGVDLTNTEKDKSDVRPFVKKTGATFPIVLDKKGDVQSTYEVTGYPTSYFIDKDGIIQYKLVGAMNKDVIHKVMGKMD